MRALKGEVPTVADKAEKLVAPVAVPDDAMNPGDKNLKDLGDFKPYLGVGSLPEAPKDKKGVIIGRGERRFFVINQGKGTYDVMAKYKKRCGTGRYLHKCLKLKSSNKAKAAEDKAFLMRLRKLGIPGAGEGPIK